MRARSTPRVRGARCPVSVLVLVLLGGLSPASWAGPAPIPWRTDFDQAQAEARARRRPIWAQFTGPWCFYCRRMDRETFARPEIVALSRDDFIPVKIRADEREDLLQRLGVSGLPTTVILDADGTVLGRREGYLPPDEFLGFLFATRPPRSPEPTSPEAAEVALAGYDVVRLVSGGGLAPGTTELAVAFDGLAFHFADAQARDRFLEAPERFLPSNRGRCVVHLVDEGRSVPGDPRFAVYYRGRLYLCADEPARQRFAADPARYADADLGDAGHCPHCRTLAGRLVRGLPQFSVIHQGRRYLFPDPVHLEAFRAAPERFLR